MRRVGKIVLAAVLFGGGLGVGSMLQSNAEGLVNQNIPGTANDPIVTKSYVDEAIKSLTGVTPKTGNEATPSTGDTTPTPSARLVVVELNAGETLAAGAGTEFIVRNENAAVAYSSTVDGISDLTDGKDLKPGMKIPKDHLLLFPREGRGIRPHADFKGTIYVMVRGAYSHFDADGNVKN